MLEPDEVGAENIDVRLVRHLLDVGAGGKRLVRTGDEDAAEEAARSMSAEAAYRLEKSFERDEAMRGTSPT